MRRKCEEKYLTAIHNAHFHCPFSGRRYPPNIRQISREEGRFKRTLRQRSNASVLLGQVLGEYPSEILRVEIVNCAELRKKYFVAARGDVQIVGNRNIAVSEASCTDGRSLFCEQADLNTNVQDEAGAFYGVTSQ